MNYCGGRHQSYRTACVGGLSGNHVDMAKGVANGCCGECGIGSSCGIDGCGIGGVGDRREKTWTNRVAGNESLAMRAIAGAKHGAQDHGCDERQHHRPEPTQGLRYQLETWLGS